MTFESLLKLGARLAVLTLLAVGASACSSMPDWVDPTTWIGGNEPSDRESSAGETPDLASLPDRPTPTSTADEQRQVAASLSADRSRAKYSTDALRGGTEPSAPPPPPAPPPSERIAEAQTMTPPAPPPADTQAAPAQADTNALAPDPRADTATADSGTSAPPPSDSGITAAAEPPPAPPPPAPSSPAASAPPPSSVTMAMVNPSDAALGFKPSTAPPLDPTIGQFVAQPIISRYDQTARAAGLSGTRMAAQTYKAPAMKPAPGGKSMGGPDTMSGAVVANLDVLQSPQATQAAVYTNAQGLPPSSVIFFPGDGTLLNGEAKLQIRAAVEQFKQRGGQGFIRVVGHSSSRTSNMPLEKHLEVIFNKSQDRANAVAQEVIHEGVPANRVLVEAVGDSQPVYYESMPKGEDGNRRAEIFLQS